MSKNNSNLNTLLTSAILFSLFIFSVSSVHAAGVAVLKNAQGKIVGRISYNSDSIVNNTALNAFCLYKFVTENVSCEQVESTPENNNGKDVPVRLVNQTDNSSTFRSLWGAIFGVDKKVDNLGNQIGVPQVPVVTNPNIIPGFAGSFEQNNTQSPQEVVQTQTRIPREAASPSIVYQVIERAVPGPKGEKGDKGEKGEQGISGQNINSSNFQQQPPFSFPGTAVFNGYVSVGQE